MTVKQALLRFPPGVRDKTIEAAWHALCHYEADDYIRNYDTLYKEEQINYLRYLASILKEGANFPQNIIDNYSLYYKYAALPRAKGLLGLWECCVRYLSIFK